MARWFLDEVEGRSVGEGEIRGGHGMNGGLIASDQMGASGSLMMGCLHSCGSIESMMRWVLDEVKGRGGGEGEMRGGHGTNGGLLVCLLVHHQRIARIE